MKKSLREQLVEAFGKDASPSSCSHPNRVILDESNQSATSLEIETSKVIRDVSLCLQHITDGTGKDFYSRLFKNAELLSRRHSKFYPYKKHEKVAKELCLSLSKRVDDGMVTAERAAYIVATLAFDDKTKNILASLITKIRNVGTHASYESLITPDDDILYLICIAEEHRVRNAWNRFQKESNLRRVNNHREFFTEYRTIERAVRNDPGEVLISIDDLTENDLRLIFLWYRGAHLPSDIEVSREFLISKMEKHEFTRLVSARLAEKAVANFYISRGHQVIDTSLGQLFGGDNRWKSHDLEVSGSPIDVKNARESFSAKLRYVEHCAKNKHSFISDHTVLYGVLSTYNTAEQILSGNPQVCRLLGSLTSAELVRLQSAVNNEFGELIDTNIMYGNLRILQGWLFEYKKHTASNAIDTSVESISKLWKDLELPINKYPTAALCQTGSIPCVMREAIGSETLQEIDSIKGFLTIAGFTKRAIFTFLLCDTLRQISKRTGKHPSRFIRLIYLRKDGSFQREWPLGLYDPLNYIWELLNVLSTLCTNNVTERLYSIRRYKLTGSGLLRGWDSKQNRWISIIAYCGGWNVTQHVKCGKSPLYLGESEICEACGHLICTACRYCSKECPQCGPRQLTHPVRSLSQNSAIDPIENGMDESNPWVSF